MSNIKLLSVLSIVYYNYYSNFIIFTFQYITFMNIIHMHIHYYIAYIRLVETNKSYLSAN